MIKKCFHKLWDWKLSSIYPTKVTGIWEERQKSFLHLEQRKLTQKGLVLYNRIRSQIPLVPKVVAKRWAELYLKKKKKTEREHTRLKKELLLSDPRMHWCLLEEEKKNKIFSQCTHCSFWNFLFVKYFLETFSCLGTRIADWYIPFLTSRTPLSHEYTFFYVLNKSLYTNKPQKSNTQM